MLLPLLLPLQVPLAIPAAPALPSDPPLRRSLHNLNPLSHVNLVQAHPGVPVVESLEDIWKVSRLQRERKQKEERERLARLQVGWLLLAGGGAACDGRRVPCRPAACARVAAGLGVWVCDLSAFHLLPPTSSVSCPAVAAGHAVRAGGCFWACSAPQRGPSGGCRQGDCCRRHPAAASGGSSRRPNSSSSSSSSSSNSTRCTGVNSGRGRGQGCATREGPAAAAGRQGGAAGRCRRPVPAGLSSRGNHSSTAVFASRCSTTNKQQQHNSRLYTEMLQAVDTPQAQHPAAGAQPQCRECPVAAAATAWQRTAQTGALPASRWFIIF